MSQNCRLRQRFVKCLSLSKELSRIWTIQKGKVCEPHLERVVFTTGGDTDPLIIEHRAAQVVTATALQAGVRIW